MKRELREHIYIISEISIVMNRECARFARSNNYIDLCAHHRNTEKVIKVKNSHELAQGNRNEYLRLPATFVMNL